MKKTDKYYFFWNGPFSQWYKSEFTVEGITFVTAEQYMMYNKAKLFEDDEIAELILKTDNPSEQKMLGRSVKNFDKKIWERQAKNIVTKGNIAKFSQNEELLSFMKNTKDLILVEASSYDKIWGIGLSENDPDIEDESKWQGTNWLGECLMKVRKELFPN